MIRHSSTMIQMPPGPIIAPRAMILAAGLGTRLKPFTDSHPKALFRYGDKTLLEHALDHLRSAGITDIIINVHHFAAQIVEFVRLNDSFGMHIVFSDESDQLLETGGGLKKASWFFKDCRAAVVRNADIISGLDLGELLKHHMASGALATLAVRERTSSRYFLFDDDLMLRGWENRGKDDHRVAGNILPTKALAFSGIQVVDPAIFPMITEEGRFSLTDLYIRLAASYPITGYLETGGYWADIGKSTDGLHPITPGTE